MKPQEQKVKKLKFDDVEYNFEDLPHEAKNLLNGLKTVDLQLKMYGDTVNLLNYSKNKMLEEMKSVLNNIKTKD